MARKKKVTIEVEEKPERLKYIPVEGLPKDYAKEQQEDLSELSVLKRELARLKSAEGEIKGRINFLEGRVLEWGSGYIPEEREAEQMSLALTLGDKFEWVDDPWTRRNKYLDASKVHERYGSSWVDEAKNEVDSSGKKPAEGQAPQDDTIPLPFGGAPAEPQEAPQPPAESSGATEEPQGQPEGTQEPPAASSSKVKPCTACSESGQVEALDGKKGDCPACGGFGQVVQQDAEPEPTQGLVETLPELLERSLKEAEEAGLSSKIELHAARARKALKSGKDDRAEAAIEQIRKVLEEATAPAPAGAA